MNFLQMKQRLFLMFFLLITGGGVSLVKAQSIDIRMLDGTEQTIGLNSLGKVTFSNNNMLINQITGTTKSYSSSKIRKIYFEAVPTGIENNALKGSTGTLSFYPNPVENSICFRNAPDDYSTVTILRMDGAKMLELQISSENNFFNVSNLNKGFYLLKVNNQVFKFLKL
jgi:hypothetical protein